MKFNHLSNETLNQALKDICKEINSRVDARLFVFIETFTPQDLELLLSGGVQMGSDEAVVWSKMTPKQRFVTYTRAVVGFYEQSDREEELADYWLDASIRIADKAR